MRRRTIKLAAGLIAAVGIAAAATLYYRHVADAPVPPAISTAGVDPAIVEAVAQARSAVVASPRSGAAWGRLGMVLYAHDFYNEAAEALGHAERFDGDDPRWPHLHACAIYERRPHDALPLLRRAAELAGDDPLAPRLMLAEQYIALNMLDEAQQELNHVLKVAPDNARALLAAARLLYHRDQMEPCITYLQRAVTDAHAAKASHDLLAQVYAGVGRNELAEHHRQASASLPRRGFPDPYVKEASALEVGLKAQLRTADIEYGAGRVSESVAMLRTTVQQYPDSEWAWVYLGRALLKQRRIGEGRTALTQALRVNPSSPEALFRMGVSFIHEQQYTVATEWFRRALKVKPDMATAHQNLGYCLQLTGDRQGAATAYRQALVCQPDFRVVHMSLAEVLLELNEREEARKHLEQAQRLNPDPTTLTPALRKFRLELLSAETKP